MDSSPASQSIQITGITVQLESPLEHSLLIKLSVDDFKPSSLLLDREQLPVHEYPLRVPLTLCEGSILSILIQEKHPVRGDKPLAQLGLTLDLILLGSDRSMSEAHTKKFPIHLKDHKKKIWLNAVEFSSAHLSYTRGLDQTLPVPANVSSSQKSPEKLLKDTCQDAAQKLGEFKSALDRLRGAKYIVGRVMRLGGIISELHPITKALSNCVQIIYDQTNPRNDSHQKLLVLTKNMEKIVNVVQPAKDIVQLNELKEILREFLDLMKEALDFIEIWAIPMTFPEFVLTQSDGDKINELNERYVLFEKQIGQSFQVDAAVKIYSLLEPEELKFLKDNLLDGVKTIIPKAIPCIPGTRASILADVAAKIDCIDGPNILWIRGAPGSGKSSLSLSVKSRLLRQGRLVTYFRFDRHESIITTPTSLWRHIGYDLARQIPGVGAHVLQELRDHKAELDSPTALFASLVEQPLSVLIDLPVDRSFVIIIDALDECGGVVGRLSPERKDLLQILRRWPNLPKHFKLLVTSREESDISRALSSISTSIHIPSGSFLIDNFQSSASIEASRDIRTFLEGRFSEIRAQLNDDEIWPGTKTISNMVYRAAGNFMWATAATNFIDEGVDPEDRLDRIMGNTLPSSGMEPLYSLYCTILEIAFGKVADNGSEAFALRAVLGTMICAKRTLSDDELIKLPTQIPISHKILRSIRNCLGSVIVTGSNLRFIHKSFDDFLFSEQCPPKYAINIEESHHLLAVLCITTMNEGLHFNMCDLETSCLKNVEVPDIDTKIAHGIPPLLSYSSLFWADHLNLTSYDDQLMSQVKAMTMDKLLYWFEAMSLLKRITQVSYSILSILKWSQPSPDEEFKEFLRDARQFIGAFGSPIAQSAPHIYISALPFAPEYSPIAQHFLPQFPRTLELSVGRPADWTPCIFVSKHHEDWVGSVTVSPDETYFISRSTDGVICVCDSETGNLILGSPAGRCRVQRAFFGSESRYFWTWDSNERLIRWDVETGDNHLDIHIPNGYAIGCCHFNGEENPICVFKEQGTVTLRSADTGRLLCDLPIGDVFDKSVLSPDGCYIAGIADDRTAVRILSVDGRGIRPIRGPSDLRPRFQHTSDITALSFSIDDNSVVSGSSDGTILIWDARTGDTAGPLLDTREGWVYAVAYSHKSRLLISIHDESIMVWNIATTAYEAVLGPLNNIPQITSVTMSYDGRRALMGYVDGTVMRWDLERKGHVPVVPPNEGHTGRVKCIAFTFSPCGRKLASLGDDHNIYLWDANTGRSLRSSITLTGDFSKLIFSPDGRRLVAYDGSLYGGIRVWDMDAGKFTFRQHYDPDRISHVAFRSTDQKLVTCSSRGVVRILSLEDSDPLPPVANLRMVLALSPDGLTAFVRNYDWIARHYVWSTITHRPLPITFVDDEHLEGNLKAYYSSSGKFIAVASHKSRIDPSTLRIWNAHTGELNTGPLTLDSQIRCLAFSPPDGSPIAFSDNSDCRFGNTTAWIRDGRNIRNIDASAFAFSPDGQKLVSSSRSGEITMWNTQDLLGDFRVPAGFMSDPMHIRDGWVMDASGKPAFWVPADQRSKLAWRGKLAVVGGKHPGKRTQVDLTRFRYGEKWAECFEGS